MCLRCRGRKSCKNRHTSLIRLWRKTTVDSLRQRGQAVCSHALPPSSTSSFDDQAWKEALLAEFNHCVKSNIKISLGELHSIMACAHSVLDGLAASSRGESEYKLPVLTTSSLVALVVTAAGMSNRMTEDSITENLRPQLLKLHGLRPRDTIAKECSWINCLNAVDGGQGFLLGQ